MKKPEAKVLSDVEMLDVIKRDILGSEIDDVESYSNFLKDLAEVICNYHGGEFGRIGVVKGEYFSVFHKTEDVPDDGGIYKKYDPDVDWSVSAAKEAQC